MKLGELRGLIRKTSGNPIITLVAPPGAIDSWKLAVQKTPLLEELNRIYPGGKGVETDLEFNPETGVLWCPKFNEKTGMPLTFADANIGSVVAGSLSVTTGNITTDASVTDDDIDLDLGDDDIDLSLDDDIDLGL